MKTFLFSVALGCAVGVLILLFAYFVEAMVPKILDFLEEQEDDDDA